MDGFSWQQTPPIFISKTGANGSNVVVATQRSSSFPKSIAGKRDLTSRTDDGAARDVTRAPRVNNIYSDIELFKRSCV